MLDSPILIERATEGFVEWERILELLSAAFAYQKERIDPPSSVYVLTINSLAEKASGENLFLARIDRDLAGCVFARDRAPVLYISKFAVWPHLQCRGIGRNLMHAVEVFARETGCADLELETRIELTENHRAFESLGFSKTSEHAHEGYDHPTYIRMRKRAGA